MTELVIGAIIAGVILLFATDEETLEERARREARPEQKRRK